MTSPDHSAAIRLAKEAGFEALVILCKVEIECFYSLVRAEVFSELNPLAATDAAKTEPDGPCQEEDGCPTEIAVLQRFWRESLAHPAKGGDWLPIESAPDCEILLYFPHFGTPDIGPTVRNDFVSQKYPSSWLHPPTHWIHLPPAPKDAPPPPVADAKPAEGEPVSFFHDMNATDVSLLIDLWSNRPQPGTPEGIAWEKGCEQGWQWGRERSPQPCPKCEAAAGEKPVCEVMASSVYPIANDKYHATTISDERLSVGAELYLHPIATPEDVRDAERYRWLRRQHWNEAAMYVVAGDKSHVRLGTY